MRHRGFAFLLTGLLAGCATMGGWGSGSGSHDRPPLPLDAAEISSDARIDSAGALAGSFIGEGTSREVHLLSSDRALVADLVRQFRPELRDRRADPMGWLQKQRRYAINLDRTRDSTLLRSVMLVGSPDGHTPVRLTGLVLHAPACSGAAPQAEFVVEPQRANNVSLRGPVVGSFRSPDTRWPVSDRYTRAELPEPSEELVDTLLFETGRVMDSLLAKRLTPRDLPLTGEDRHISINSLENEDAADVVPFRLADGLVRYAVSLRAYRRTARGTDVMGAIVMVWNESLQYSQVVFRPTLLELGRRGPTRPLANRTLPYFWRRLQPVSGFAFRRDYLWMEQVDVGTGAVRWVILEPKDNIIVAAADVEDGCRT
jgi:hypothetical protein